MKTKFRRLPLETLVNARDLGGYATQDGKVTKYGRFIRSELPKSLSEKDMKFLADYGVTLTLDFRTDNEVETLPSCLSESKLKLKYIQNSVFDKNDKNLSVHNNKPSAEQFDPEWSSVYIHMADNGKAWVKRNMELVADWDGGVLYHCMTGKDRTGIFTAMLLGLCNAYPADIIADYSISQVNLRPFYLEMMCFPEMLGENGEPDLSKGFYQTRPETMYRFLEHINSKYGNMTDYLKSCGLSEETLSKIVQSLTEDVC